jgi:hypothetical protein
VRIHIRDFSNQCEITKTVVFRNSDNQEAHCDIKISIRKPVDGTEFHNLMS